MQFVRRIYGENPIHLIILLAALTLTVYTISVMGLESLFNPTVWWQSIAVWFAVAIIAHDLILFPLYALADRVLALRRRRASEDAPKAAATENDARRPALTNYIRMPTLASALLLIVFLPGIIEQGAVAFYAATGLTQEPYLTRWLAITAVLYLTAAVWFAVKTALLKRGSLAHHAETSAEVPQQ